MFFFNLLGFFFGGGGYFWLEANLYRASFICLYLYYQLDISYFHFVLVKVPIQSSNPFRTVQHFIGWWLRGTFSIRDWGGGGSCQVLIRKACLWIILDNMFVEHQALISDKDISYGSYKQKVLVDWRQHFCPYSPYFSSGQKPLQGQGCPSSPSFLHSPSNIVELSTKPEILLTNVKYSINKFNYRDWWGVVPN